MMKTTLHKELQFAYQVRRMLNERLSTLPENTANRLTAARQLAIGRKKAESPAYIPLAIPRLADDFSMPFQASFKWLAHIGRVIPLLVLVLGSISIYYYEESRRIDDLAELDAAVLTDELPIDAYLDHGFNTYLNKHGE